MEDLNKKEGFSRRGFLKTAAAVGAALAVTPALDKVQAATRMAAGSKAASGGDAKAATITAPVHSVQARRLLRCRHWDSV